MLVLNLKFDRTVESNSQIDYHILNVVGITRILAVGLRKVPALLSCAHVIRAGIGLKLEILEKKNDQQVRQVAQKRELSLPDDATAVQSLHYSLVR